ncbi:MAG: FkbM family methyltransferase [Chitinophagales bacterium]|nr:FkbM family methyltransferase [Bacteroidota bacterium]MCB9255882.1 FkbM family methyltransferase [Chitinophagales bacterium]
MKNILRYVLRKLGLYAFAITVENKLITIFKEKDRMKMYEAFIKPGSLVFDVGANEGNRTDIFLKLGAKVVAVEPQMECIQKLEAKFGNKIDLIKKGLDEKEGKKLLYKSDTSLISSFNKDYIDSVKDDRFKGANWTPAGELEMTTLDALIDRFGVPDFCKIDVEGFEQEVLKGLSRPLKALSYEFVVPENLANAIQCLNLLMQQGAIECNFSYGESMDLVLDKWKSGEEMLSYIQTKEFESFSYGDIYVRFM